MLVAFAVGMANLAWMLVPATPTGAETAYRVVRGARAAFIVAGLVVGKG